MAEPLVPVRHRVVGPGQLPGNHGVVAFVSSQRRTGPWQLAPATRVVSVLGDVELDLREAELADGETVIEIFALLGNVEIVVPPGVRVLNEGDTLAGTFNQEAGDWDTAPGAPVVRVVGTSYLANVEIRQQAFGETPREARRRRKRVRRKP